MRKITSARRAMEMMIGVALAGYSAVFFMVGSMVENVWSFVWYMLSTACFAFLVYWVVTPSTCGRGRRK